jgi:hypothetical protein
MARYNFRPASNARNEQGLRLGVVHGDRLRRRHRGGSGRMQDARTGAESERLNLGYTHHQHDNRCFHTNIDEDVLRTAPKADARAVAAKTEAKATRIYGHRSAPVLPLTTARTFDELGSRGTSGVREVERAVRLLGTVAAQAWSYMPYCAVPESAKQSSARLVNASANAPSSEPICVRQGPRAHSYTNEMFHFNGLPLPAGIRNG